ncbi:MAG TPA: trehalase-like domain-containing protein, partial [Gaiellaceae bacterium]
MRSWRIERYLPIAEHGVIGDLHTVALVGTNGTIDWLCLPRFDSPSVFASILDADRGGFFAVAPRVECATKQLYFPDTNVLITRFLAPDGVGEVVDFMPVKRAGEEIRRHRLCRRISTVRGELGYRVEVRPAFDYGRVQHETRVVGGGVVFETPDLRLSLHAPTIFTVDDGAVVCEFALAAGQSATFVLEMVTDRPVPPHDEAETADALERTIRYWRGWLGHSRYRGRWRETVHRSALTLKLLTYRPTGAIVAAPTTSLPEIVGGSRNWDYRYTWIRDAAFSLFALLRLGFTEEAAAFMTWLTDRFEEPDEGAGPLQLMYGIDGRSDL